MEDNNTVTPEVEAATTEQANEPVKKTEEKLFTQSEVDSIVKKAKLKADVQREQGKMSFLIENGFNTVEDFNVFKQQHGDYMNELNDIKTKAEKKEIDSVFESFNINNEAQKTRLLKLTEGEEGRKSEVLTTVIQDLFGDLPKQAPQAPVKEVSAAPKKKVGLEKTSGHTINGQSLDEFYKERYAKYNKNK